MSGPDGGREPGAGDHGVRPATTPGLHQQGTSRWSRLWKPFWSLPAAIITASALLGIALPNLDTGTLPFVFSGGADSARTVLSSIIGGMISLTGLVFSITIVVLQQASSQFTPRILRQFLAARVVQVTLGVFTGTFVYGLTVLRTVQTGGDGGRGEFVPQVSVTVAMLFVLLSVGLFLAFIAHITRSAQVSRVITDLTRTTRSVVRQFEQAADAPPRHGWEPEPGTPWRWLYNDDVQGYVVAIHGDALVEAAGELDVVVRLDLAIGQYVAPGARMGTVWGTVESPADDAEHAEDADDAGDSDTDPVQQLRAHVMLDDDRYIANDPMFGVRQLVDIAERALSPGVNDPTTAVQVIDSVEAVLRAAAAQSDPSTVLTDPDGRPRVTYRAWTFDRMLSLSMEEISRYGDTSPRVQRSLRQLLVSIEPVVLPEHGAAVQRWRTELEDHDPDSIDEDKDIDT